MKRWSNFSRLIVWLIRFAGATLAMGGLGLFVLAWPERSASLIGMGVITIAAGGLIMAFRSTENGNIEYRLFRSKK